MGKILLDIPHVSDGFIQANSMDEAIIKLKELQNKTTKETLDTIKRFKGILKQSASFPDEDWYRQ